MRFGIFTSLIEPDAEILVNTVTQAAKLGKIPNTEMAFIFSNREIGENPISDAILHDLESQSTPLITFSASRFLPDLRSEARKADRAGDPTLITNWRNLFAEEVLKRLPYTDLDLLLGDMWIWGERLCKERHGLNLHPALPEGPKGEWYNVIWQLIAGRQFETGVMMHQVTPELDRGSAATYCRFSITGDQFDCLWDQLPQDEEELATVISQSRAAKEIAIHPLFRKIREEGFKREIPLIIGTAAAFAEGSIKFAGDSIVNHHGEALATGYDLTVTVDQEIRAHKEGGIINETQSPIYRR